LLKKSTGGKRRLVSNFGYKLLAVRGECLRKVNGNKFMKPIIASCPPGRGGGFGLYFREVSIRIGKSKRIQGKVKGQWIIQYCHRGP